jgi:uncharacterized membrane protein HdeD (DUF308 family)
MAESPTLLNRLAAGTRHLGLGLIGLGVLTALAPAVSGGAVVVVVGLLLLAAGLALAAFGWRTWSADKGALGLVVGGLTTACGVALVANPVSSLSLVTTLVAIYFVVGGLSGLIFGRRLTEADGRRWALGDALLSIGLGVAMWVGWPISGVRALGLLVGLKLVSAGAVMVRVERALRSVGDRAANLRARLGATRPFDRNG